MAIDAYVNFGEATDPGPDGKPLPAISGDSDDAKHPWWCELRSCGFDMEAQDQSPGEADAPKDKDKDKQPKTGFHPVQLSKRVDWATTSLFYKCCEAAEATTKKTDDEKAKGRIDQVTVELCRPGAADQGEKIPFAIVRYYGVRITHFGIEISSPEPSESITFEFDGLDFEYQQTDPYTGKILGKAKRTTKLANHTAKDTGTAQPNAGSAGASGTPAAAPGAPAPGAGAAAVPAAPGNGNGSHGALRSATDGAVRTHHPPLWPENGFGVLPH